MRLLLYPAGWTAPYGTLTSAAARARQDARQPAARPLRPVCLIRIRARVTVSGAGCAPGRLRRGSRPPAAQPLRSACPGAAACLATSPRRGSCALGPACPAAAQAFRTDCCWRLSLASPVGSGHALQIATRRTVRRSACMCGVLSLLWCAVTLEHAT